MRIKLEYRRDGGAVSDIVVTTDAVTTVGEVATTIASRDGASGRSGEGMTLAAAAPGATSFVRLPGERPIGDSALASGYAVRIIDDVATSEHTPKAVVAVIRVIAGPDVGREFELRRGSNFIGRGSEADIVLRDGFVSKVHARIEVSDTVEFVDLNSANGLEVGGGLVSRWVAQPGQTVVMGDTELAVQVLDGGATSDRTATGVIQGAALPFNRSPRVEPRHPSRELPRPQVPRELDRAPFPWLLMLVPITLGLVMFLATGNPLSLLFIAAAPLMLTANYVMGRQRQGRKHDSEVGRFEAQFQVLERALAEGVPREREVRLAESAAVGEIHAAVMAHSAQVWTRRPEHWNFLHLRLGVGTLPSRTTVASPPETADGLPEYAARVDQLVAAYRDIAGVPVTEDLELAGALGVVGQAPAAPDAARGLLVQLAGLYSPAELVLGAFVAPQETAEYGWMAWLPHTSSTHSPVAAPHLVDSPASGISFLAALEELVEMRSPRGAGAQQRGPLDVADTAVAVGATAGQRASESPPTPEPVVVVLVTARATVDRGRLVQLAERGPAAGVFVVWLAEDLVTLPAACRTYLDVRDGLTHASVGFVRHGSVIAPVGTEGVSVEHAESFARRLSCLVDSGAVAADQSDLPQTVGVLDLLGEEMADSSSAVVDRWQLNESIHARGGRDHRPSTRKATLRALVGQAGADALHLDLRQQGPHALVGGTTGAGKSEFLQSWIIGMAAEYSPDRLTFLFIDYKGGAAFSDCIRLPHFVGQVTDLTPHLVNRALESLRAELRYREHLFNTVKVKDILEFERRGDDRCPPVLVLVIDEFAALVNEVPEFVDGVVDIAQRGRSLGIHLIMATQRPAGVIRDNLRANTNLRIALRMADESDSVDVVGSPVASAFDAATPGRAVAKTGPGRLTAFQSAYAGGWSAQQAAASAVTIHDLRFGAEVPWAAPEADEAVDQPDPGPTDLVRLVDTIGEAAVEEHIPLPRRPWLDPLGRAYDLRDYEVTDDAALVLGVSDLPELQRQDTVAFLPDDDGNLAVYGTSGSGKTVLLRSLAASAGLSADREPVHVYGLDFAAGGLRMLEPLPHVGSIVSGDDHERVVRTLRLLRDTADRRARDFPAADAGSITEYRRLANRPAEPRILLLIDNFPAFRNEYDGVGGRAQWYGVFQQLLSEGRALGIHVVFTADRPASVPGSVAASVPRRVVLRLSDDAMYTTLDVPHDVLDRTSPPGRAVVDRSEVQIGILGGSGNVADQSAAIGVLAEEMVAAGREPAPRVGSMPTEVTLDQLPVSVGDEPVLGISDVDLAPTGFEPRGTFLLGGGPASGRSTALASLVASLRRFDPDAEFWYLGNRRSSLPLHGSWKEAARTPDEVVAIARSLSAQVAESVSPRIVVVVESVSDFVSTPADGALVELFKAIKRSDHLAIVESETSTWSSSWPVFGEVKSGRRGLILQPDTLEGEAILRTAFPRVSRAEFPPGRGLYVQKGKVVRVQVPTI